MNLRNASKSVSDEASVTRAMKPDLRRQDWTPWREEPASPHRTPHSSQFCKFDTKRSSHACSSGCRAFCLRGARGFVPGRKHDDVLAWRESTPGAISDCAPRWAFPLGLRERAWSVYGLSRGSPWMYAQVVVFRAWSSYPRLCGGVGVVLACLLPVCDVRLYCTVPHTVTTDWPLGLPLGGHGRFLAGRGASRRFCTSGRQWIREPV